MKCSFLLSALTIAVLGLFLQEVATQFPFPDDPFFRPRPRIPGAAFGVVPLLALILIYYSLIGSTTTGITTTIAEGASPASPAVPVAPAPVLPPLPPSSAYKRRIVPPPCQTCNAVYLRGRSVQVYLL